MAARASTSTKEDIIEKNSKELLEAFDEEDDDTVIGLLKLPATEINVNYLEPDKDGYDPYFRSALFHTIDLGSTEIMKILLARPELDPNAGTPECPNVLFYLCYCRHSDPFGTVSRQPLNLSSAAHSVECLKLLLDDKRQIDVNAQDQDGETALFRALARGGNEWFAKELLQHPDINIYIKNIMVTLSGTSIY